MKKKEEKKLIILNFIFINLLGFVFIICSLFINNSIPQTIFIGIGVSLCASGIILIITFLIEKSHLRLSKNNKKSKKYTSKTFTEQVHKDLCQAKKTLDIITLNASFIYREEYILRKKLDNGLKIRILTLNPNIEQNSFCDINKDLIIELINVVKYINRSTNNPIEIKYCDYLKLDFYIRMDDILYINSNNIFNKTSISQKLENNKQNIDKFKFYTNYFDQYWEHSN